MVAVLVGLFLVHIEKDEHKNKMKHTYERIKIETIPVLFGVHRLEFYFSSCCVEPVLVLVSEWITFHFILFSFVVSMRRCCCCYYSIGFGVSSNVSY